MPGSAAQTDGMALTQCCAVATTPALRAWVDAQQFSAAPGALILLPGVHPDEKLGIAAAAIGIGDPLDPYSYAHAPHGLPPGDWELVSPLGTLLDRQGRSELRAWATARNPGLAEWTLLVHGDEPLQATHLPDKAVLRVLTHHENRD